MIDTIPFVITRSALSFPLFFIHCLCIMLWRSRAAISSSSTGPRSSESGIHANLWDTRKIGWSDPKNFWRNNWIWLDLTGPDWTWKEFSGIIICTMILISSWKNGIFQSIPNNSELLQCSLIVWRQIVNIFNEYHKISKICLKWHKPNTIPNNK